MEEVRRRVIGAAAYRPFEGEGIEFQRTVAAAYDDLASRHPERIVVIAAEGSPEAVHERVMDAVARRSPPLAREGPA